MTSINSARFEKQLSQELGDDAHVALGSMIGDFIRERPPLPGRHDVADVIAMMQGDADWGPRVSAILPDTCFGESS